MYEWLIELLNTTVYGLYLYRVIPILLVGTIYCIIAAIVGVLTKKYNPDMFKNGEPAFAYGMFWPLMLILGILFSPIIIGVIVYTRLEHKLIENKKTLE